MKLGFVSAILDTWTYEEMMSVASDMGFACVEVACWPQGKAERRYAGVSHIDAQRVISDESYRQHILDVSREKKVEISSLAFYPNTLDADLEKRQAAVDHLMDLIEASKLLGVNMVTTFIGRDQTKTVEQNMELVAQVWPPIVRKAEQLGVRIGIENCPMLFGKDQWPGGQNIFTSPSNWKRVFEILDSDNLGINFDPSHFVWQMMDYVRPVRQFRDKMFHIHFKDIKLYKDKLDEVGTMAYPLEFMQPKLPCYGDVKWDEFVGALTDIGYDGYACIEIEDRAFEGSREKILKSLEISKKYMENFVI